MRDLTGSIEFSPVRNFSHQVWALKEIDGNPYCWYRWRTFHDPGIIIARMISGINSFTLFYMPEKDWLFVGGNQGLSLFQTKPAWKLVKGISRYT